MLQLLILTEEAGGEQHYARKDAVKLQVLVVVQVAGDQLLNECLTASAMIGRRVDRRCRKW